MKMRTRKLYETDGACHTFAATVLECRREGAQYAVILDQTAFFPEGGGQYADRGTLNGIPVSDVQIKGGEICHYVASPATVGETVEGHLDAALRHVRMQNHTGEHILCGIAHRRWGCNNVGFHLGEGEMTMDLDMELTPAQLDELERAANAVVWSNVAVRAEIPDAIRLAEMEYRSKLDLTEDVRIVTIEGIDACACCAPHVARTGEIGMIKILSAMRHRGGMRLFVLCGAWALEDYQAKHRDILTISQHYSAKPHEAVSAVRKADEDALVTRAALGALKRELVALKLSAAVPDARGNLLFFEEELDGNLQRSFADGGADRVKTGICGVFCATDEPDVWRYVCVSRSCPLREFGKAMNAALNGRGGGSDAMIQGTLCAKREEIVAFWGE